ncbi:hypothetical protein EVAR_60990_1 [Eumeta japonica]|uniref:Uncharacterized protein n=1 Tax=Eumeta variegata TaxID=151549 RepID=A0A4C1ZP75_EUMVA|nr:hypothetical protein EVAR_60990_1 [Eumeta japonica]
MSKVDRRSSCRDVVKNEKGDARRALVMPIDGSPHLPDLVSNVVTLKKMEWRSPTPARAEILNSNYGIVFPVMRHTTVHTFVGYLSQRLLVIDTVVSDRMADRRNKGKALPSTWKVADFLVRFECCSLINYHLSDLVSPAATTPTRNGRLVYEFEFKARAARDSSRFIVTRVIALAADMNGVQNLRSTIDFHIK